MADDKNQLIESRRQEVLKQVLEESDSSVLEYGLNQENWMQNEILLNRKYDYSEKGLVGRMGPVYSKESHSVMELAPDTSLSKKQKNAIMAEKKAIKMQAEMSESRLGYVGNADQTEEERKNEVKLLKLKLEAIGTAKEAGLDEVKDETKRKLIELRAAQDIEAAYRECMELLQVGSKEREKIVKEHQDANDQYHALKKEIEVSQIENEQERLREQDTIDRHALFDFGKKLFRRDNELSHQDKEYYDKQSGTLLINRERAYFGGTKPMYIFEDRSQIVKPAADGNPPVYKEYLYKEAITCIGFAVPERALATEGASKLQEALFGRDKTIRAFAARDKNGKVIGSFQEKIATKKGEGKIDLFSWQADPQTDLDTAVSDQVLREHTLDWLLCNFDTKGENFLQRESDGQLLSIDKEASFSIMMDNEKSRHMDRTFKPHSNETIYNTIFKKFVEDGMALNLDLTEEYISKIENMSDDQYFAFFEPMVTQKFGAASPGNTARQKFVARLMERKQNLRMEYKEFYGKMVLEREDLRRRKLAEEQGVDIDQIPMQEMDNIGPGGMYIFPSERSAMRREVELARHAAKEAKRIRAAKEREERQKAIETHRNVMAEIRSLTASSGMGDNDMLKPSEVAEVSNVLAEAVQLEKQIETVQKAAELYDGIDMMDLFDEEEELELADAMKLLFGDEEQAEQAEEDTQVEQRIIDQTMDVIHANRKKSGPLKVVSGPNVLEGYYGANYFALQSDSMLIESLDAEKAEELEKQAQAEELEAVKKEDALYGDLPLSDGYNSFFTMAKSESNRFCAENPPKDVLGFERRKHVAKIGAREDLSQSELAMAKEDFQNMFVNFTRDEMHHAATSMESEDFMVERMKLSYLSSSILQVAEREIGASSKLDASRRADVIANKLSEYSLYLKNTAGAQFSRALEKCSKLRGIEKVRQLIAPEGKELTAYEKEMLRQADIMKEVLLNGEQGLNIILKKGTDEYPHDKQVASGSAFLNWLDRAQREAEWKELLGIADEWINLNRSTDDGVVTEGLRDNVAKKAIDVALRDKCMSVAEGMKIRDRMSKDFYQKMLEEQTRLEHDSELAGRNITRLPMLREMLPAMSDLMGKIERIRTVYIRRDEEINRYAIDSGRELAPVKAEILKLEQDRKAQGLSADELKKIDKEIDDKKKIIADNRTALAELKNMKIEIGNGEKCSYKDMEKQFIAMDNELRKYEATLMRNPLVED